MPNITERLNSAIKSLLFFENKFQRPAHSVQLIAVSKTKPVEDIMTAIESGQRHFGENYVQEGVDKVKHFNELHVNSLEDDKSPLIWHFIGPIQSNKSKLVAENFDWVHTIERVKIAKRLNEQRGVYQKPLQVLIQINISGEESKSGIAIDEAITLAHEISGMNRLTLRGLMTIGIKTSDDELLAAQFSQMNQLFEQLKKEFDTVDTLSMGMSGDLPHAIEHGSTMVRVGSAIFGARNT